MNSSYALEHNCALLEQSKTLETLFRLTCGHGDADAALFLENGEEKRWAYRQYEAMTRQYAACLRRACSLGELCALMYTRRYPAPRLRRLATDAALGYGPDLPALPPYLHVLGGQREALSLLKNAPLPAGTSLARLAKADPGSAAVARTTAAAFDLRALCRKRPGPMGEAYTRKPVFPQEK